MKLISIEPTPNPNSMKLNFDESLSTGVSRTYTTGDRTDCPDHIGKLLDVPGVKSLFHLADFIAVERHPRSDWQGILAGVRRAFGEATEEVVKEVAGTVAELHATFGEVRVEVQMFRDIPMLVKVSAGTEVIRKALPERFTVAVNRAAPSSPNMLAERKWVDQGARYGELQQIAQEVAEDLAAAYDEPPRPDAIPVFAQALGDPQSTIRRLAAVYLGLTGDPAAVPPLCAALADETVSVRRTAGDSLSDLADRRAIGPMTKALEDRSKLVRWRAARFLYETGDESALPALQGRKDDPEFEVRMQVRLAIERIEGGHSGQGSVWRQMTR